MLSRSCRQDLLQGIRLKHPSPAWLWSGVMTSGSMPGQGSLQKAQQSSGFFPDTLIEL